MPDWKREINKRLADLKLEPTREVEIVDELSQHLDDRYTGMASAFVLMRSLASQLYEVKTADPLGFSMVACDLLLVAFVACYVPARRASKLDPMEALRRE